ncbi:hypothetical protein GLP24_00665 [Photobacterium carnosum]|uniref:hypothetical protein n=1 Tax=Photobacterium carnosum TaxID=2023717 RepID=UPI001E5EE036|nr:hypothetical protein [Photobacterium carnosum]MCD9543399.1 hypothetical protein [Photobacterium carnosum]
MRIELMDSKNLKSTTALFKRHLFSQDKTVTLVLKAHLILETIVESILDEVFPVKESLVKSKRFNFNQKVELCYSLNGFNEQAYNVIKALNNIRNSCAHELKEHLRVVDLSPLASALGKDLSKEALSQIEGMEDSDGSRTIYASFLLSASLGIFSAWLDIAKGEIK